MKKSRISLWFIVLAVAISGVTLYFLAPANEDDFPHPLNGLFRELHGVSAMLGVFIFGYMFADHVQKKLHKKKRYWDGYVHLCLWILLVTSGLLLYYPQDILEALGMPQIHWYLGLSLCCLFPLHFWRKAISNRLLQPTKYTHNRGNH
jgi:hypothetical protein